MQHGESTFKEGFEGGAVEVADGELGAVVENDGARAGGADPGQVDQVGTVDPEETVGRELLGEAAKAVEDDERFRSVGQMDLDILAHALDIPDRVRRDENRPTVGPEGQDFHLGRGCTHHLKPLLQPFHGSEEFIEAERLQEIVDGIDPESFQGEFRISRCKDEQGRPLQGPHEIESGKVRHIDVHQHCVGLVQKWDGCRRAMAGCESLEERHFRDIHLQLPESQRLIIYEKNAYHSS